VKHLDVNLMKDYVLIPVLVQFTKIIMKVQCPSLKKIFVGELSIPIG